MLTDRLSFQSNRVQQHFDRTSATILCTAAHDAARATSRCQPRRRCRQRGKIATWHRRRRYACAAFRGAARASRFRRCNERFDSLCGEQKHLQFFYPLVPIEIEIMRDDLGRPNGLAKVEFETFAQAKQALAKNRSYIGSRWIELQLVNGTSGFSENVVLFSFPYSCRRSCALSLRASGADSRRVSTTAGQVGRRWW